MELWGQLTVFSEDETEGYEKDCFADAASGDEEVEESLEE